MRVVVVVLAVLALNACTPAPSDTAADLKAIEGLRNAYVAAFNAEDADKTAAVFATDGIYMGDKASRSSGATRFAPATEKSWRAWTATSS